MAKRSPLNRGHLGKGYRQKRTVRRRIRRRVIDDAVMDHTIDTGNPARPAIVPLLKAEKLQTAQRVELAKWYGATRGNLSLQRAAHQVDTHAHGGATSSASVVQRDGAKKPIKQTAANPGGRGPGRIQGAAEAPYDVNGVSLNDISGQLNQFGGFAAETEVSLAAKNGSALKPVKLPDGTFQLRVQWITADAKVHLPRWNGYDNACPAAQKEWDRFMAQSRIHEQQAHINAANTFVKGLGEADTVITGKDMAELQSNVEAKQQELGQRLQAIHDACDHGVGIDALLHPQNGACEEAP